MVRISDARMSGTAYGTCVLHVSPESFVGGPLALVRDGDLISLDVENRRLDLLVSNEELAARRAQWVKPAPKFGRGYMALYAERVTQAHLGCDFDFLDKICKCRNRKSIENKHGLNFADRRDVIALGVLSLIPISPAGQDRLCPVGWP